jgi:hypothetical protein
MVSKLETQLTVTEDYCFLQYHSLLSCIRLLRFNTNMLTTLGGRIFV